MPSDANDRVAVEKMASHSIQRGSDHPPPRALHHGYPLIWWRRCGTFKHGRS